MSLVLAERLKKVNLKVLPVYLMGVILLVEARPSPDLLALGLPLITLGEGLRVWAAGHLRKNQEVTTSGPYAHVKNPLYLGTFLIMVGFCTVADQFILMAVGLTVFLAYYVPFKRRRESERLRQRFAQSWIDYDASVPDYWPRWTPYENRAEGRWSRQNFLKNSEHETLLVVVVCASWMFLKGLI